MYHTAPATPLNEWGGPTNISKENARAQTSLKFPRDIDAFVAILRARREFCECQFSLRGGGSVTLIFCYKITCNLSVPCKLADFSLQPGCKWWDEREALLCM